MKKFNKKERITRRIYCVLQAFLAHKKSLEFATQNRPLLIKYTDFGKIN